ncbi:MAG: DNA polymerase III subunit [Verrucomicrobiota bacterium]|nr:DNA polymerase III subunit [Verrucomicrobiota bacterium]
MSFADFPEQKQPIALLQRSLERGRLGHAYLFSGNDLSELEAVARTLAKTLNCQLPPRRSKNNLPLDGCDQCDSCRRIDDANYPDVFWVRPESKSRVITIEQIRDLMQIINLKPSVAEFKLGIMVAADRLNPQAANAFLKTLEEPPPKSVLILLSAAPQKILETILSRCLRLNFAGERKQHPAETEWLSDFSQTAAKKGGLLERYRLLGVLIKKLGEQKTAIEKALTARSPLERYDDLEPKLRDKLEDQLSASIEAEYRRQRADLLVGLQWWLRDVWLQTLALPQEIFTFPQFLATAQTVAKRISPAEAMENLQILEQTQRLLSTNVQEALALEVGLLKLKL